MHSSPLRSAPRLETDGHVATVKYSLLSMARRELRRAVHSTAGSSSTRVPSPWRHGDSLVALRAGTVAPLEHTGPRTLQVLVGRVRVSDGRAVTHAGPGEVVCCGPSAIVAAVADTALLMAGTRLT